MNRQEVIDDNTTVLANAVELGAEIIKKVAGNAISNTVEGEMADDVYLKNALASKLHSKLAPAMGS